MKDEKHWWFRVNGKSYEEWLASRIAAGREALDAAAKVLAPANGTPTNGTPTNGHSAPPTNGSTAPVDDAARQWESAADRPRVVCWRQPPTAEQEKRAQQTGEVVFVPSCGPAWQGRRGRQPSPVETCKEGQ